jgi:hypothetical protein
LTFDLAAVRTKIKESKFQRGFTNMAQAFSTADKMLAQGGRPAAQSAVMVISDGKFSFKYQTAEKAKELKDKNVMIYMAPITETKDKTLDILKTWASQPWETNYERIPGLQALQFNTMMFVQKLLVKFCPDSISPTLRASKDSMRQYILIHENGFPSDECGEWISMDHTSNKDECARQCREAGFPAFSFGRDDAFGDCYGEVMIVTQDKFDKYKHDPSNPAPPCGSTQNCPNMCEWWDTPYFDSYVINPSSMGEQKAAR